MRCDLARNRKNATTAEDTATVGFERKLWASADALRNNMDAADKHVVLGLILLKYISDAFEARYAELDARIAHGDTFHNDLHPDPKADYVIANPPFNDSDWHRKDDDVRWQFGEITQFAWNT